MKRELQPWEFGVEIDNETKVKENPVVRYPFYRAEKVPTGYVVKMVEKGGKRNKIGNVFYCNEDGLWLRNTKSVKGMPQDTALSMIDTFIREDRERKDWWRHGGGKRH